MPTLTITVVQNSLPQLHLTFEAPDPCTVLTVRSELSARLQGQEVNIIFRGELLRDLEATTRKLALLPAVFSSSSDDEDEDEEGSFKFHFWASLVSYRWSGSSRDKVDGAPGSDSTDELPLLAESCAFFSSQEGGQGEVTPSASKVELCGIIDFACTVKAEGISSSCSMTTGQQQKLKLREDVSLNPVRIWHCSKLLAEKCFYFLLASWFHSLKQLTAPSTLRAYFGKAIRVRKFSLSPKKRHLQARDSVFTRELGVGFFR